VGDFSSRPEAEQSITPNAGMMITVGNFVMRVAEVTTVRGQESR